MYVVLVLALLNNAIIRHNEWGTWEGACKKMNIQLTANIWVACLERRYHCPLRNNCLLITKVCMVKLTCWQVCQWPERSQLIEVSNRTLYDWQTETRNPLKDSKQMPETNYKKSMKYLVKKKSLRWNKRNVLTSTKWKFILKTEQVME